MVVVDDIEITGDKAKELYDFAAKSFQVNQIKSEITNLTKGEE